MKRVLVLGLFLSLFFSFGLTSFAESFQEFQPRLLKLGVNIKIPGGWVELPVSGSVNTLILQKDIPLKELIEPLGFSKISELSIEIVEEDWKLDNLQVHIDGTVGNIVENVIKSDLVVRKRQEIRNNLGDIGYLLECQWGDNSLPTRYAVFAGFSKEGVTVFLKGLTFNELDLEVFWDTATTISFLKSGD